MESNVFTAFDLINNDIQELPCLFGNVIPQNGLSAVVGASESGKSLFLRQLCMSIVTDKPFLGWENKAKHRRALFLSTEDGISSTSFLVKKQNEYFGMSEEEARRIRFIFSPNNPIDDIKSALDLEAVDIVVVDSFADILNGRDEKSASDVRSLMQQYQQLSEKYGCLIIFLHHISKRSEFNAPNKNSVIGSQSFEAKCRLVLEIREDNSDTNIRHLCLIKANYISKEEKMTSYDLTLNDNLVFENENTRTPLSMLSITKPSNLGRGASTIPDKVHMDFLTELFVDDSSTMSGAAIKRAVRVKFTIGDTLSRQYLDYYRSRNMILVDKETKNCTTFKVNVKY